ncbi:MAG: CPBP family intramembrane metalloprotease [Lachnospiraceae bacterium]|nr:CPBP family intramembrane metalloprotease [Lachnospiraceae bacterium]
MEQIQNKNSMKNAGRLFFILMILTIPISLLYGVLYDKIPEEYRSLFSILISQGYLLVSALIYLWVTKTRMGRDLNFKKFKISSFLLSILVLIAASPMSSLLNTVSQLFAKNTIGNTMFDISENLPLWAGVLVIGCLPGFIEELIYRGILYSAFKKHSILFGIIICCLSFGLMHGNFNQIPYAIYLGVIFTLLVEATGSLASSMILHMLFNGMSTIYLYVLPQAITYLGQYYEEYANMDLDKLLSDTPTKAELLISANSLIFPAIIGLIIAILLLRKIAKMNGNTLSWQSLCERKDNENPEKPISGWLIAGWIICILLSILSLYS